MGWLIGLGIVIALALLPLGGSLQYSAKGFDVRLILGPVQWKLYPRPSKKEKPSRNPTTHVQPEPIPEPEPPKPAPRQAPPAPEKAGGDLRDFLPLVQLGLRFLGDFRRKLRVKTLELRLTLAADDPCDLAVNYGRAWSAVGNLIPQLERLFVIQKRDVEVQCDFTASEPRIYARLVLTITFGRLLSLAVLYGLRALREFLTIRNKRKGGAAK